jgi:hypothetical protein
MYFKLFFSFTVFCLFLSSANTQTLLGLSSRFNNAFVDWDVYADSIQTGNISMTWQQPDNWGEWSYRIGEKSGTIKTKWSENFTLWELRGDNKIITAQPVFPGNVCSWRITDNNFSLELNCRNGNDPNEWTVEDPKRGTFFIYTNVANDQRDWVIDDNLSDAIPFPMRMMLTFIALFNSVPKE